MCCCLLAAERRLGKADFVAMNHQPTEDSLMVSVLPVSQLEDIYDRVVHDEIMVRGETSSKDFAVGMIPPIARCQPPQYA